MTPAHDIVARSREVLAVHSRSFSWAARFLPADARDDAAVLYAFCREVDDVVDEAPDAAAAREAIERLSDELDGRAPARPAVAGFLEVSARRGVDRQHARDLVAGVRSDLGEVRLPDDRALLRYCYRVASTVGLMMSPLIGATDPRSRPHAVDLGVGMQLTNIARDVAEDAGRGRVYLPATRLAAEGVTPEALLAGRAPRDAVARVVAGLLALAERYYASGDAGMRWIRPRPRLAILVASRVYRAIGRRLLRRGGDALAGRTVVPWTGKLVAVLGALGAFLRPSILGLGPAPIHDAALHEHLDGLPGAAPASAPAPPRALAAPR